VRFLVGALVPRARTREDSAFDTNAATPHTGFEVRTKAAPEFHLRSRWCYCAKIIAAVVVAFLLVASSVRLPAVPDPGRGRLRQVRHLAAAAAAAGAVVAEAADH